MNKNYLTFGRSHRGINSTVGCTQPVGTDSFGGMSCLKFHKGLVDQSTNLSDITEKKFQTIFLTSI